MEGENKKPGFQNLKVKEIGILRPYEKHKGPIIVPGCKYPKDPFHLLTFVKFDNGQKWIPTLNELDALFKIHNLVHRSNLENDLHIKKV